MVEHLEQLKILLNATQDITGDDWNALMSIWSPVSAKRKEILTHVGDTEKYLYFVTEGVQRVYYTDDKGREATIVFTYAPSFGGVLDSFLLQKPSRYTYETLTPSRFFRTPYSTFNEIVKSKPLLQQVMITGLSDAMSGMMERMVELQAFTSEEKFKKLLNRSPHILQLVPHKYLANYLGMDATNFSKLINSVKV